MTTAEIVERARRHGDAALVAGVLAGGEATFYVRHGADERTLFEIGSITKPFTGVLLAEMCLRGEVSLDDPVSKHLPASELPRWRDRPPTLEELATHRTGLPKRTARHRARGGRARPRPPLARSVGGDRPGRLSRGGARHRGSAGARRPVRLLEPRLRPARRCPFSARGRTVRRTAPGPDRRAARASRHRRRGPAGRTGAADCGPLPPWPPAAAASRPHGLRRSDPHERRRSAPLPRGFDGPARRAAGACTRRCGRGAFTINKRLALGLGWMVLWRKGKPVTIWHSGGTWGFRSFAAMVPASRTGVVVLTNTTRSIDRLGMRLVDALG